MMTQPLIFSQNCSKVKTPLFCRFSVFAVQNHFPKHRFVFEIVEAFLQVSCFSSIDEVNLSPRRTFIHFYVCLIFQQKPFLNTSSISPVVVISVFLQKLIIFCHLNSFSEMNPLELGHSHQFLMPLAIFIIGKFCLKTDYKFQIFCKLTVCYVPIALSPIFLFSTLCFMLVTLSLIFGVQ